MNTDPRYLRSRARLREALVDLGNRDPQKLTVSQICGQTGVDRATFYRHFDGLDELVADTLEALAGAEDVSWDRVSRGTGDQEEAARGTLAAYLQHIVDNWTLYRWALLQQKSSLSLLALLTQLKGSVERELLRLDPDRDPVDAAFAAAYLGGGLLGTLLQWLDSEQPGRSPAELAHWALTFESHPTLPRVAG